jgi:hypothetical protein
MREGGNVARQNPALSPLRENRGFAGERADPEGLRCGKEETLRGHNPRSQPSVGGLPHPKGEADEGGRTPPHPEQRP